MSNEFSHDLYSARSTLRRWIWKTPETDDRVPKVLEALEILDSLDLPETIETSLVSPSVAIGGLQFEIA